MAKAKSKTSKRATKTGAKSSARGTAKGGARKAQARGRQLEIPGAETKVDAAMHAAVAELVDTSVEEGKARTASTEARDAIAALMVKKKITTYLDPKLKVRVELVTGDARVRMKSLKERGAGGDGESGDDGDVEAHEVEA